MRRIFTSIVAAGLIWPATAGAQRAAPPDQRWDRRGDPVLIAEPVPDGKGRVSWRECPAHSPCRPIAGGARLAPGNTAAGTRFEVVVEHEGRRTRATSMPWLGRLDAVVAPRLRGRASAGAVVDPVPGTWSGGWAGYTPRHELWIDACRTPATGCVVISEPRRSSWGEPLTGTAVVLPDWVTGRYVRVLDRPLPRDVAFLATPGLALPADRPPVAVSAPLLVAPALLRWIGPPFSDAVSARGR